MFGTVATRGLRFAAIVCGAAALAMPARAQSQAPPSVHLGVASCSGGNCHGAMERPKGSAVPGNEYIIWSKSDKHRQAYAVLLEPRSERMARALGLGRAERAPLCLNCHADYVAPDRRGNLFQLSDGVGCEACHGGASGWLGVHISGATHQQNIAAGLYPTDRPLARAEKCMSCHVGDATHYVDHRIYGAGHPRLAFELDTYTANQPAHFVVDPSYVARKGRVTDMQVWAVGQAEQLVRRMEAVTDPKHAPQGMLPEYALYDCQSCHHPMSPAAKPNATGLGTGTIKLYDANAVMLRIIAARVAPEAAKSLAAHIEAMHKASPDDWAAVRREAETIRGIAARLVPVLARHEFNRDDMRALGLAQIALGSSADDWQFSHGEQIAMALEAIVTNLKSAGFLGDGKARSALAGLSAAFADDATFDPSVFAKALKALQPVFGR